LDIHITSLWSWSVLNKSSCLSRIGSHHAFHSIRITAITQLVRVSVAGAIIAELVGHETGTVTYDVYSQGHSAVQKLEAISKLPTLPIE
jgi:hypothetical protein